MPTQYSLFKGCLNHLLVLASLILCLGADSCSQCKQAPNNEEQTTNKVVLEILPLISLSLVGQDKTIQCKLQQANNSAAIDLAKLQLKITAVSTPTGEYNKITYQGASVDELLGEQVGLDQAFQLTIDTTTATEEVVVTLQIVYKGTEVGDPQVFVWNKDATADKKVVMQIVPLSSQSLVGDNKLIQCKLQQANNSVAVDLVKLRLKITAVSTPANDTVQVSYKNAPVSELSGEQVGLDQAFQLTIDTKDTTEKVDVILQVIYEGVEVGDPQIFTWNKDATADKKVVMQIVPLSSQSLVGDNKLIQCKLQQANNSAAVDLVKLRLKITAVSTPANDTVQVSYKNAPVSELSGEQVGLDQLLELTVAPISTAEKVIVTLQVFYEAKPLENEKSSQTFTWELDVTMKLFQAISYNNKEEAIALLNKGNIRADAKNDWGQTLLHESIASHNDLEVVEKLISVPGIDLNAIGGLSLETPLEVAIAENQLDIFKLLLKQGAQVQPGTTIMHAAIWANQVPIIKYIIDNYGELKDSKDKDGNTPLHIAVQKTYPRLANSLFKKEANRLIKNNVGKTPEDLLQEKKETDTLTNNLRGAFNGTYTDIL